MGIIIKTLIPATASPLPPSPSDVPLSFCCRSAISLLPFCRRRPATPRARYQGHSSAVPEAGILSPVFARPHDWALRCQSLFGSVSARVHKMRSSDLLPRLPGGGPNSYHRSFYKVDWASKRRCLCIQLVLCSNTLPPTQLTSSRGTTTQHWSSGSAF